MTRKQGNFDVYQTVTDTIVAQLEAGLADGTWQRPWQTLPGQPGIMPTSLDGRSYRGINVPLLMGAARAGGYTSQLWATYRRWQKAGAQVRKGEKGTMIVFWKFLEVKDDEDSDGNETRRRIPVARAFTVFAAEQVDNFDLDAWTAKRTANMPSEPERLAHVETTLNAYFQAESIPVTHGGDCACYIPAQDAINMPPRAAFTKRSGAAGYYAVLCHEATHSTGVKGRLNRDMSGRFGDQAYAMEELVAELSAAMQCAVFGISDEPRADHAKYVKSWLRALRNDKRAIFTASSKAQQAADYILGHAAEDEDSERYPEAA